MSELRQPTIILCHECDLAHEVRPLPSGLRAFCRRCGAHLYNARTDVFDQPLAWALGGLVLFFVANFFPFMTFKMEGREQMNNLVSGAIEFWQAGYGELAILVFLASTLLPLCSLLLVVYVLLPLKFKKVPWMGPQALRALLALRPWAMMEVYLLGVLVAIVKLTDFADIVLGYGFYAFVLLILTVTAANVTLRADSIWLHVGLDVGDGESQHETQALASCHGCGHVVPLEDAMHRGSSCPRCLAALHHRKPNSLSRAWALLLAAFIFYIPANIYPIMTVISFGKGTPDTIMSGVVHLIEFNQWPIAILVFFASVFVPILKILIIGYLLISVQRGSSWRPRQRTVAYRLTEFIGRWSMIDIFMISILVALVKLDAVATIEAGPGAVAFAAVVILTMLSAMAFGPRLIWDRTEEANG